ncbi:hypothetical protein ACIA5C_45520 [Actinoplanes sp. NPDC051343]|uniref:hypothetical protein n=1 Tax=Actinoplanes sp. NPDC051343 TaxID=3363906 RepID=UPI0037B99B93
MKWSTIAAAEATTAARRASGALPPAVLSPGASLDVSLTAEQLSELDALSTPDLNFPYAFLLSMGFPARQGTTSINGIRASERS